MLGGPIGSASDDSKYVYVGASAGVRMSFPRVNASTLDSSLPLHSSHKIIPVLNCI